jgi:hypothetical protein
MAGLDEALNLIGLGTPFVYGAAAYGLFHWLDKNASDEAKAAISDSLKIRDYDRKQVASALVEVFDRLYTQPLFHWRAFVRSMVFTIIVFLIWLYELAGDFLATLEDPAILIGILPVNVLLDYVALFIIRPWLGFCGSRPVLSLTSGFVIGICIVGLGTFVRFSMFLVILDLDFNAAPKLPPLEFIIRWLITGLLMRGLNSDLAFWVIPASLVFLWLPLFATGIVVLRAINLLSWTVEKMQWFLKQGKEHPLEAIGYVAGAIVFVCAAVWARMAIFGHVAAVKSL